MSPENSDKQTRRLRFPAIAGPLLRERVAVLVVMAVAGGNAVLFAVGLPLVRCPFRSFTGLNCPGCGMTRAVFYAATGQWQRAFEHHPFGIPMALGGVFVGAAALLPGERRRRWAEWIERVERKTGVTCVFLGLLLLYGIARLALQILGRATPV